MVITLTKSDIVTMATSTLMEIVMDLEADSERFDYAHATLDELEDQRRNDASIAAINEELALREYIGAR